MNNPGVLGSYQILQRSLALLRPFLLTSENCGALPEGFGSEDDEVQGCVSVVHSDLQEFMGEAGGRNFELRNLRHAERDVENSPSSFRSQVQVEHAI